MPSTTPFLMWYDDGKKTTLAQRITEACEAYKDRFGIPATLVLINPDDGPIPDVPVTVQTANSVQRNVVWAGRND